MEKDLISIIIPVYNVESYLERCINSILNQTYKKFEAIFINDGSTDNSLDILKKYQEKDKRIIIINKDNAGTGAARNDGLNKARGEFISFLDSDDWYDEEYLEELYKNLKDSNSDIAMCNLKVVYDNKEKNHNTNVYSFKKVDLEKEPEKILGILAMPVLWNKLYKRELILKYSIKFPNYSFSEDVEFLYKLFLHVKVVSKVEKNLYNYYQRLDSATKKIKLDTIEQVRKVLINIESYINKNFPKKKSIFNLYKIQFLYSVSITFLSRIDGDLQLKRKINLQNKELLKDIKIIEISRNKKILIYYLVIKLNKILLFFWLINKLKRNENVKNKS